MIHKVANTHTQVLNITNQQRAQIKTTIKMALTKKKKKYSKRWWGYGETGTLVHLEGLQNGITAMENSIAVPHNIKKQNYHLLQQSHSGYKSKRTENRILKRYLHTCTDSSTIHNGQEVDATQMSLNRWTDKQNVVYTLNAILSVLKRKPYHVLWHGGTFRILW